MKTPRIEDFDPHAAPKLKSPLDEMPTITRREPVSDLSSSKTEVRSQRQAPLTRGVQSEEAAAGFLPRSTRVRSAPMESSVRPYGRTLARIPFEIYQDQHAALKQFSLDEQSRGERGSMSQMVR